MDPKPFPKCLRTRFRTRQNYRKYPKIRKCWITLVCRLLQSGLMGRCCIMAYSTNGKLRSKKMHWKMSMRSAWQQWQMAIQSLNVGALFIKFSGPKHVIQSAEGSREDEVSISKEKYVEVWGKSSNNKRLAAGQWRAACRTSLHPTKVLCWAPLQISQP